MKGKGVDIFFESGEAPKRQKATFYFPQSILQGLDDLWLDLRRRNRKLKKSDIVVAAVKMALEEYAEKGEESTIFRELSS